MAQALSVFLPLFGFMLIPVWIPIVAAICGAVHDRLRPQATTPALLAVEAAKARTRADVPAPREDVRVAVTA